MAEHVTVSRDMNAAATQSGMRLVFVPDSEMTCTGCFFRRECTDLRVYVFSSGSPVCVTITRPDRRNGHWALAEGGPAWLSA